MKGGPFGEKFLEKKSHNAEKLKGGTLWGFSTSILSQNIKKMKGEKFLFSEKNLTVPKKIEGGTLWGKFVFRKKSLAVPKKVERKTLWGKKISKKKSRSAEKKLKGGPFGFARYGMLRGKIGKTFLVQFARPNGAIWCNDIL